VTSVCRVFRDSPHELPHRSHRPAGGREGASSGARPPVPLQGDGRYCQCSLPQPMEGSGWPCFLNKTKSFGIDKIGWARFHDLVGCIRRTDRDRETFPTVPADPTPRGPRKPASPIGGVARCRGFLPRAARPRPVAINKPCLEKKGPRPHAPRHHGGYFSATSILRSPRQDRSEGVSIFLFAVPKPV